MALSARDALVPEDLGFARGTLLVCGPGKGFRKESGALIGEVAHNRNGGGGWAWRVLDVRPARSFGLHLRNEVRLLREGFGPRDACLAACNEALQALAGGVDVPAVVVWRPLSDHWERRVCLAVIGVLAAPLVGLLCFVVYDWLVALVAAIGARNLSDVAMLLDMQAFVVWLAVRMVRNGPPCEGC